MNFRKANINDIDAIEVIYNDIHAAEAAGEFTTGWIKGVYPTRDTALASLERDDLFVMEDEGEVRGAAVINQIQVDVYENAPWKHEADDSEVCVIHALTISPGFKGKGYGKAFVRFYEKYAVENGMPELRIDTNITNLAARGLYRSLGFEEISVEETVFNGIPGIRLIMLEKHL